MSGAVLMDCTSCVVRPIQFTFAGSWIVLLTWPFLVLPGIVTHKGASADGGHYIGWVKKDSIDSTLSNASSSATPNYDEAGDEWYKFDDDKVSVFPKEKLATLDGGGEDSSAYVLVYKSRLA